LDISQASSVNELKEKFFQQFPNIDILINVAGIGIIKSIDTLDESDFLHPLNVNLVAPFLLIKEGAATF
jgi:NAD(P)-dependent dehydrogenase (short-subunit alcohol dehydrogenase family)